MSDPVMTAAAVALVTKTVEALAGGGKAAFGALSSLVRQRFSRHDEVSQELARAGAEPGLPQRRALADALSRAAQEDHLFAEELHQLWLTLMAPPAAGAESTVHNGVIGDVQGSVIQARDVHGGISLGQS